MFDARILLGAIVGAHVDAVVELTEALLPGVVGVALVGRDKLELAGRGVHQRRVVLEHRLVQTFPVHHNFHFTKVPLDVFDTFVESKDKQKSISQKCSVGLLW